MILLDSSVISDQVKHLAKFWHNYDIDKCLGTTTGRDKSIQSCCYSCVTPCLLSNLPVLRKCVSGRSSPQCLRPSTFAHDDLAQVGSAQHVKPTLKEVAHARQNTICIKRIPLQGKLESSDWNLDSQNIGLEDDCGRFPEMGLPKVKGMRFMATIAESDLERKVSCWIYTLPLAVRCTAWHGTEWEEE